jgi:hypothetical protein
MLGVVFLQGILQSSSFIEYLSIHFSIKLLNEVGRDMKNHEDQKFVLSVEAEADNTNNGLDNFLHHAKIARK